MNTGSHLLIYSLFTILITAVRLKIRAALFLTRRKKYLKALTSARK